MVARTKLMRQRTVPSVVSPSNMVWDPAKHKSRKVTFVRSKKYNEKAVICSWSFSVIVLVTLFLLKLKNAVNKRENVT